MCPSWKLNYTVPLAAGPRVELGNTVPEHTGWQSWGKGVMPGEYRGGGRLPSITSHLHKDRAFLIPSPNRFFCRRQRWGFALKNKGRVFQHDGYRVISISDEYLWWGGKRWCWHTASVNHMTSWFTGERTMNVVFWIDCPKTWFNTETLFFKKYGEKRKSSGLVLLSSKSHWSAYSIEVEISGWQFYIPLGSRY